MVWYHSCRAMVFPPQLPAVGQASGFSWRLFEQEHGSLVLNYAGTWLASMGCMVAVMVMQEWWTWSLTVLR